MKHLTFDTEAFLAAMKTEHRGDETQLAVVFSKEPHLLVEAPAGYGKTRTLVSRIAQWVLTRDLAFPKKALCLTFSLSAAYKMRRDLTDLCPKLISGNKQDFAARVLVSNYHGFSRRVLSTYGELISTPLRRIGDLKIIDEQNSQELSLTCGLSESEACVFSAFKDAVQRADTDKIKKYEPRYRSILLQKVLPAGCITYNSILMAAHWLFTEYPEIRLHYQRLFTHLVIDEFQDTNYLAWRLILDLFKDENRALFLGDPLQRIYGFIGAMPNLLEIATRQLGLKRLNLNTNHRFPTGSVMNRFEKGLRKVAENPDAIPLPLLGEIPITVLESQIAEATWVAEKAVELLKTYETDRIAVLVRGRSPNTEAIAKSLQTKCPGLFWALFSDDDSKYLRFHQLALSRFEEEIKRKGIFGAHTIDRFCRSLASAIGDLGEVERSLMDLLKVLLSRVSTEYRITSFNEKCALVEDCLVHRGLKQYMEFLPHRLTLITAHGAKGLEWDHVILPDLEKSIFPSYFSLCSKCKNSRSCDLSVGDENAESFVDELSVFYVAVTRARKTIAMSASRTQLKKMGGEVSTNISCFVTSLGFEFSSPS